MRGLVCIVLASFAFGCARSANRIARDREKRAAVVIEKRGVGDEIDIGAVELPNVCGISAVGFRTEADGWVADACGHMFRTLDGGLSFQALERADAPVAFVEPDIGPPAPLGRYPHNGYVNEDRVTRIDWRSPMRGVMYGTTATSAFSTDDGGASWVPIPNVRPEGPLEHAHDSFVGHAPWGNGRVAHDATTLAFFRGTKLVRRTRLLTRGSEGTETLRGVVRADGYALGWTDHALAVSLDEGASWAVRARLDRGRIVRAGEYDRKTIVVTSDGRVLRLAGTLVASPRPEIDAYDLARTAGEAVESPLACLRASTFGALSIDSKETYSCYDAWDGCGPKLRLELTRAPGVATLDLSGKTKTITPVDATAIVEALIRIVDGDDDDRGGDPRHAYISGQWTTVEWRCDGQPLHSVIFFGSDAGASLSRSAALRALIESRIASGKGK